LRSISGSEQPIFVCADKALLSAARNEGCPILDPVQFECLSLEFKWAGNQEAVTFLAIGPFDPELDRSDISMLPLFTGKSRIICRNLRAGYSSKSSKWAKPIVFRSVQADRDAPKTS